MCCGCHTAPLTDAATVVAHPCLDVYAVFEEANKTPSFTIYNNPNVWPQGNSTMPTASGKWFPMLEAVGTLDVDENSLSHGRATSIVNMTKLGVFGKLQNVIGNLNVKETDLHNLTVLRNVQFIAGNVNVEKNVNMAADSLVALRRVKGSITFSGNPNLSELQLCRTLEHVDGGLEVYNNGLLALECPSLSHVGGGLVVASNAELKALGTFARLTHIGGTPNLEQKEDLAQNIFPVLEVIDGDVVVTGQKSSAQSKACSVASTNILSFTEQLWEKGAFDNLRNITGETMRSSW